MNTRLRDCLRFKPFDETSDGLVAGGVYARSSILTVAVFAGACLGVASLVLALTANPVAPRVLAAALGVSAITAGLEWHAGLKARSLNQLFAALVIALGFWLLSGI